MNQRPILPENPMQLRGFGASDGAVIQHAGRYARECVLLAFEMMGGVDRLYHWADRNPGEFYTKLFTKTITREVEMSPGGGIEDLLAQLDRGAQVGGSPHPIIDAEIIE